MSIPRDFINAFGEVWRRFLHDCGFAWSVTAVFGVAAVLLACQIDAQLIAAAIMLGCLAIAMEFNRRD